MTKLLGCGTNLNLPVTSTLLAITLSAYLSGSGLILAQGAADGEKSGKHQKDVQTDQLDYETSQEQDKQLFEESELANGDKAPNISLIPLKDKLPGKAVTLASLYKEKPVVMLMGSCTCGMTKDNVPGLERLYSKYGTRAHFVFVYMKDAHPSPGESVVLEGQRLPLIQPKTLSQRTDLARYLISETELTIPVYLDDMQGSARKAFAGFHNAAFVINTDGKLVLTEKYKYKVSNLKKALETLFDNE